MSKGEKSGAVYRSEMREQRNRDLKRLEEAKKKCTKKLIKVCNQPATWVNEGAKILEDYDRANL
jgi:hypothetical protein